MALPMVDPRINPATGLPWDEGDPNAPALPAPESFNDGSILGGGGSAAPAPVAPAPAAAPAVAAPAAASIFPAKPTYEDKTSVKTRVKSPEDLQAEANLAAAEGKTDTAQHRVGTIEAAEGDATFEGAGKLVDEKQRQLDEHAAATKARRELGIRNAAADDDEIEQVKQARIAAGGVRQHAYDGRTAARVFSAILRGISTAAEGIAGRGGPSPVQQIYEEQYAALEKEANGKADALQEAHEGKAKGRAKSEAEADREAIERKNHALLSVELIDEQLKQAIAALSPDKAKAATALREATTNENRARLRGERTALYDKVIDRDVVNRSETSTGAGAQQAIKTTVLDRHGKPVGNAPNEQQADKLAEQRRAIAKAEALREKLAELAPRISLADRAANAVVKDKLVQEFNSTLYDLGSQVSVANGQASMTGKEREDFNAENGRGYLQGGKEYADLQRAKQTQAWDQYDKQANASVIGGVSEKSAAPAAAAPAAAPAAKVPIAQRGDDEVRAAYKNALKASNAKAVTAFLAEMKRRGIRP